MKFSLDIGNTMASKGGFKSISKLLGNFERVENKYISREFQGYGLKLAEDLGDEKHKSLYIKMAKKYPRGVLESARSFCVDSTARSKGALFMWKVKQIMEEKDAAKKKAEAKVEQVGMF